MFLCYVLLLIKCIVCVKFVKRNVGFYLLLCLICEKVCFFVMLLLMIM